MNVTGTGARADDHRLRDGRLAGRVADEFTFENVRRCADGVARYVVDRGETAKGVVVAYDRRFASEHFAQAAAEILLAHDIPVAFAVHAVPTQMSSYEVVERGAAAGIVITASHNPWVDNGFKVKAPTGRRGRPRHPVGHRGAARRQRRGRARSAARSRMPRRPGSSNGSTRSTGYERFVRRTLDLDALRAADARILVDPMWGAGSGWISRLLAGGRIEVERDPPGAQPVLRRGQPGADPAQRGRGARACWPAAGTTWACCSTAMRTEPAPPTSAARSSTSSR